MARPINAFGQTKPEEPAAAPYQHQEYPAIRYHRSGNIKQVNDAEQDALLGSEWSAAPFTVDHTDEPEPEGCATCVRLTMEKAEMQLRFDRCFALKLEEIDNLKLQLEQASLRLDAPAESDKKENTRKKAA